ncbi:MAG: hypothetical protein V4513_03305 [Pseudomonadota bacterium]
MALLALIALAAPAATYGPVAPAPPKPKVTASSAAAQDACRNQRPKNDREIVVCAPRTEGYRINPDIMEAKREARAQSVRPRSPESYKDTTACQSVGPWGCTGTPSINLIAVGMVLATMARRAATGGNVGQMFVTDPQKTEYQLYLEAKARREAREKTEAAAALAKAARAKATESVAKP